MRRSRTKATARSIARSRVRRGKNGSARRSSASTASNKIAQTEPLARGFAACVPGPNSSRTVTPRGFLASGRFAISTRSGTSTVRDQYEILLRWNGNQRGSSMISTGITGTARHGSSPKSASWMRVKTLQ